ncbi:hypothetical protein AX16_005879 [Volvariella volvacea WC 439]|nr:hypothetical protein AX16_005879 [Volvariella volvacea WC 439]
MFAVPSPLLTRPRALFVLHRYMSHSSGARRPYGNSSSNRNRNMGRKKNNVPAEEHLLLPAPSSPSTAAAPIIDTHTHLASTFAWYKSKYPAGKYATVYDFVRGLYAGKNLEAIVDVWCEAPVQKLWREFADSAVREEDRREKWGALEYWFAIGVHPHDAKKYTDEVEQELIEAMSHPRCVAWGEIGLDYHYDNSPREIQREVFTRQLRHAVKLGKTLVIHTREADEDTERILKEEVPKDHKIHVHCFTDAVPFAQSLLDHFPNLCIGITGVITYSSNLNTSALIQQMTKTPPWSTPSSASTSAPSAPQLSPLRVLLETDAPYMTPGNLYASLPALKGKLPLCHSAMIPWTAEFVSAVSEGRWSAERVMRVSRDNAKFVYGI